MQDHAMQLFV